MWTLGAARIRLHIDIGFDDVLVPGPQPVRLPTMLDFPAPAVQGYSQESVIAEKYQSLVHLGILNSRMKDFYDLWLLATHFAFDGALLGRAIDETFVHRQTALSKLPVAFTPAFFGDREKQAQWQAFCRRHPAVTFPHLEALVGVLAEFLLPVTRALLQGAAFRAILATRRPLAPGCCSFSITITWRGTLVVPRITARPSVPPALARPPGAAPDTALPAR